MRKTHLYAAGAMALAIGSWVAHAGPLGGATDPTGDPPADTTELPASPVAGPLRIDPQKPSGFVNDAGPVWLTGIAVAGGNHGVPDYGWPWATPAILADAAGHGANYVHFRVGPYRNDLGFNAYYQLDDGRYDLDRWNNAFWSALASRVSYAASQGIYVELDVVDAWALEGVTELADGTDTCPSGGPSCPRRDIFSAWAPINNLQGVDLGCSILTGAPPARVLTYVDKLRAVVGAYPNVIFQIGNETDSCQPGDGAPAVAVSPDFELGIIAHLPADRLVATNSASPTIEALDAVKYVNRHWPDSVGVKAGKPTAVNEDDSRTSADEWTFDAWTAFSRGTMFHYWFGGDDALDSVHGVFARMGAFLGFVRSLPFQRFAVLAPGGSRVPGVVGIAGQELVTFAPDGGTISLDLGPVVKTFRVDWVDARTGAVGSSTTIQGAGVRGFTAPAGTDWALHVTATGGGGGGCATAPGTWEDDRFDGLALGPVAGQSCWTGNPAGVTVVNAAAGGRELSLDPPPSGPDYTTAVGKDVPDQTAGRQSFEMTIRVDAWGSGGVPLAKLEVQNDTPPTAWNKLFQVYAGGVINVQYAPTGNAVVVPLIALGHSYRLRVDFDLASGAIDVYVDGVRAATGLPMGTGNRKVTALGISAFREDGRVVFDDLWGHTIAGGSPPTIAITAPSAGATVAGVVPIATSTSPDVTRVDFFVDGAPIGSATAAPFALAWDSRVNPLPAPNHPMDLGYYDVIWKDPSTFDRNLGEVRPYTSTYFATCVQYASGTCAQHYQDGIARAYAAGMKIHLATMPGDEIDLDTVIADAAPYWSQVVRLEVGDELDPAQWSQRQVEDWIQAARDAIARHRLHDPPQGIGLVFKHSVPFPPFVGAIGLDWVGIEGYVDGPGSADSQANIDALTRRVRDFMAAVPPGKNIVLVMQAYDRNGGWTDMDTLRDLQTPLYLIGASDPRVLGINMFAYARQGVASQCVAGQPCGGTRFHPELATPHRLIAEKALGRSVACAGDGRRTITAVATSSGGTARARVVVNVANCAARNDAAFVWQGVPAHLAPGETSTVVVMMRNTGTTTWTWADDYRLGSQDPQDNTTWGLGRVNLAPDETVLPGQVRTFTFTITAPTRPGTYGFQWRMLRELVEWFGESSPDVQIQVGP